MEILHTPKIHVKECVTFRLRACYTHVGAGICVSGTEHVLKPEAPEHPLSRLVSG